jgi:hypothetical protein
MGKRAPLIRLITRIMCCQNQKCYELKKSAITLCVKTPELVLIIQKNVYVLEFD